MILLLVASICGLGAIAVVISAFLDRRNERTYHQGESPLYFANGDTENMPQSGYFEELQKHLEKHGIRMGGSGSAHHVEECWAEERYAPVSGMMAARVNFDWHGTRGYWVSTLADAERHCGRINFEAGFRGPRGSHA